MYQKRNLRIMWIANFLVSASATMILPFLSLYIETFGSFSPDYVQKWAGYVFGVTFLAAFFISPLWGRFGDNHGYKPILMITGLGIGISIFFMGFTDSVMELFLLRLVMGVVTGFIPTSLALISSQTPKEIAGKVLGTLQMGTVSGGLLGPLFGGLLADSFGFQYTFFITSFVIVAATLLVSFGIHEGNDRQKVKEKKISYTRKEVFFYIFKNPVLLSIMILSLLIQTANFSVQPLLALYVNELVQTTHIAFLAGVAFSATGFGNLLATRRWGKLGDDIGHERVILILLLSASTLFIPQALATQLWQLVLFRFMFGIVVGGIIPCMTAYIRQVAPLSMQGEVLGYNVSFRFLGNVIGPVMGGLISGWYNISTVFFVTSALFLAAFVLLWWSVRKTETLLSSS